ncbi:MAG: hypothetical protein MK132_12935 [Lentisphaerales bacterium]|nr:hypothetical protein [Lentisphaerales bacterium]
MKKMPLAQILTKFYSRDAMLYVGKNWKGNGLLLLLGICIYISLFSGYSWSKHIKAVYSEVYQPVLSSLPNVSFEDGFFKFAAQEPHKIYHPLTKKPAIFINTNDTIQDESIKGAFTEFPCIITKNGIFVTNFLFPLLGGTHNEVQKIFIEPFETETASFPLFIKQMGIYFKAMLSSPTAEAQNSYTGQQLQTLFDKSIEQAFFFTFIIIVISTFLQEAVKAVVISVIIFFMMRRTQAVSSFSKLMRLCILTYIPVLVVYGVYYYFITTPGIFTTILLSIVHIALFMKAVAVNAAEQQQPKETDF